MKHSFDAKFLIVLQNCFMADVIWRMQFSLFNAYDKNLYLQESNLGKLSKCSIFIHYDDIFLIVVIRDLRFKVLDIYQNYLGAMPSVAENHSDNIHLTKHSSIEHLRSI